MRKMLMAAAAAGLLALGAPAFGQNSPAGTSEGQDVTDPTSGQTSHVEDNQVDCGDGASALVDTTQGIQVRGEGGPEGGAVVVCNEGGNDAPVQGRVIAAGGTSGGWVAIDGDADNQPEQAQGWARVDVGAAPGITCGDVASGQTDSADSTGAQENCG
jgi:hypothetical protein